MLCREGGISRRWSVLPVRGDGALLPSAVGGRKRRRHCRSARGRLPSPRRVGLGGTTSPGPGSGWVPQLVGKHGQGERRLMDQLCSA